MDSLWRELADTIVGVHYAYMAYLVVGGFIAWRWPKTIWVVHLVRRRRQQPSVASVGHSGAAHHAWS